MLSIFPPRQSDKEIKSRGIENDTFNRYLTVDFRAKVPYTTCEWYSITRFNRIEFSLMLCTWHIATHIFSAFFSFAFCFSFAQKLFLSSTLSFSFPLYIILIMGISNKNIFIYIHFCAISISIFDHLSSFMIYRIE